MLCCALGLLPAAASAAELGGDTVLSPALQELAKPSVRSLPPAEQAQLLGVATSGPGSLIREDGQILVETRFESSPAEQLPAVEEAGGEVVASSQRYQQATLSVPLTGLDELAEVPGVAAVTPVRAPVLREPSCQGGAVITEGVTQLEVGPARTKLSEGGGSKEGEGLTIGVLSDSMAQATERIGGGPIATKQPEDIAANELPGPASSCEGQKTAINELQPYGVLPNLPPTDEGRAMAQIVHDIVPKAKLAFNSAFNGEIAFAEGIRNLAKPTGLGGAGAKLIVDDVSYFAEPFFQDGPVAVAIGEVVGKQGVTYLTSAGNDNLLNAENDEISSWEAPAFRDSGDCPQEVRALSPAEFNGTHCLDFDPEAPVDRTFGIRVEAGQTLTVDLQWAQPWGGVTTDLDAYLLDAEGHLLAPRGTNNNVKEQRPVEVFQWRNESATEKTVQLVINRFSGGNPRLKFILLQNGGGVSGTEYPHSGGGDVVGPAIYGHAGARAAITVGAVPYSNPTRIERYSSRGPATHYFGPVKGSGAAASLSEAEVISKPDVAATDCGRTTFFSAEPAKEPGIWRFCGTSAAAPHAAGVAALAIEAGASGPTGIAEVLAGTGRTVGSFGACAAGGGLLDALVVVETGGGATTPPSPCGAPVSTGLVERAAGDWGLEQPPVIPVEPEKPPTPEEPEPPSPTPPTQTQPQQPSDDPGDPAKPPSTKIRTHPAKLVLTRGALARIVFRFDAEPAAASFRCQFDGSPWRECKAKVTRWFGLGQHVVRVQARGADGLRDPTPARFAFRVARSH